MKPYILMSAVALTVAFAPAAQASDTAWQDIQAQARGQTVYFNAWGGDQSTNAYIAWVAAQVKTRSDITLKQVKIADTAEAVQRIEAEKRSGRNSDGSVDLLWVNGENFQRLKKAGLLYGPWAEQLPNWQYVDTSKPVRQDFSESTDGLEAPWGAARFTFLADRNKVPSPPTSPEQLLAFAQAHPGFTFHGCLSREPRTVARATDRSGHVQHVLAELQPQAGQDIAYLCGNPNMVDAAYAALKDFGLPVQHIRREKYISSR